MNANIYLELHGPPRVVVDGATFALVPRDAALFAWLAIEGLTTRERVLELLWPFADRVQAQSHLRQNLRRLRQRCGRELVFGESVLQLADGVQTRLHDDPDDDALLRPPGPGLLAEIETDDWPPFDEWLQAFRHRAAVERRLRIERRSIALEQAGDFEQALRFARRLVEDDPGDEDAHRRVMWLQFRRGDLAAARAAYDACRAALARTTGDPPGSRTLELLEAINSGGAAPEPAFAIAPNVVRPPRLVGRDEACRAIDAAWQGDRPALVLGEPGVGKSRLLVDLALNRQAGMLPVAARQGDGGAAYSLLTRLLDTLAQTFGPPAGWPRETLAGLVAAWGPTPSHPVTTLRLRQAVDATLDGWQRLGLRALVLDDLQYADESSLDWLVHAAGRRGATPLRMLLAVRSREQPPVLTRWQAEPGSAAIVELTPLDAREVAELLDTLGLPGLEGSDWAGSLQALTGGFAFDLLNTLMAMQSRGIRDFSAGPALLTTATRPSDATLARIRRLPDDAHRLAQIAAIAGQDLTVDLAAKLMQLPSVAIAAPWHTLERAGLFGSAGFAHDLILQAVGLSIPDPVARTLHREVAEWLEHEAVGEALPSAARIAVHWETARRWAEAGRQFERAAAAARLRSARREELNALADAVRCYRLAEPGHAASAFQCEWQRVRLLPGMQPLDTALSCANALVAEASGVEERAVALEARSIVQGHRYDFDAALQDAQEAVRLSGDPRVRLLASLQAATALMRLSRHDEALRMLEVPTATLDPLDPAERLLWLSETATALDYADRRSDALAAFDRAIAQGRSSQLWDGVNTALNDKAIALVYANRLDESNAALHDGIDCGRRAGLEDDGLLLETMTLAANLRDLGRFDEALVLGEPLPARLRTAGYRAWAYSAEHDLAVFFLWLGRPELANQAMTPLDADMPDVIRAMRLFMQARMLRVSPMVNAFERPGDLVLRASKLLAAAGGSGRSYLRLKVALELTRYDEPDAGAAKAAGIEADAVTREQHMLAIQARLLHVELLLAGRRHEAAAAAARGLVEIDSAGATYPPEMWWTAWQALESVDSAVADRCLDRAAAWIERVARQHVPAVFRTSFMTRNPINVAVLAAAARRR